MAYIGRQLVRGQNRVLDDISGSFNGSTTAFNLTVSSSSSPPASVNQLWIILGGVLQKPGTDFTVADAVITFTTAPASTLSFWGMIQGDTSDINAPSDASVTPSKIANSGDFAFPADVRFKDADGSHYVGLQAPSTVSSNLVWTLPAADGSANQILKTDGSGALGWATDSATDSTKMPLAGGTFTGDVTFDGATAGRDIVWDKSDNALEFADNAKGIFGTGADLEVYHDATDNQIKSTNGKVVITTTAGNSDIEITPNGSGNVKLDGLDWPNADGSANQYLKTDGSGALSWSTVTSTTINSNADNRIITGSGTANTLEAESSFTYNAGVLTITGDSNGDGLFITNDGDHYTNLVFDADRSSASNAISIIEGKWNNTQVSTIRFETGTDTTNKDDGRILFQTRESGSAVHDALVIEADGDVKIHDGDLIIGTSTHGIDFSATGGGAGTDTNELLADYEEGTFTVEVQNGWGILNPGYAYNEGQYVKVGDMVCCTFRMQLNAGTTNGNQIYLTGLPYAALNVANKHYPMWSGYFSSAASDAENVKGYTGPNQSYVYFSKTGGTGTSIYTGTMAGTSFDCYWTCTYRTN